MTGGYYCDLYFEGRTQVWAKILSIVILYENQ
jgi:hypothetical protein